MSKDGLTVLYLGAAGVAVWWLWLRVPAPAGAPAVESQRDEVPPEDFGETPAEMPPGYGQA